MPGLRPWQAGGKRSRVGLMDHADFRPTAIGPVLKQRDLGVNTDAQLRIAIHRAQREKVCACVLVREGEAE